jgi:hypothetical protein
MDIHITSPTFFSQSNNASYANLARIITETLDLAPDKLRSLSLDALINQLVSLKALSGAKQAKLTATVMEAVVLSSSPLVKPSSQRPTQHQVVLKTPNNQQYQITSQTPLPVGSNIQLKLNSDNTAVLIRVLDKDHQAPANSTASQQTTAAKTQAPGSIPSTALNNSPASSAATAKPTIDLIAHNVREILPQQQPLRALLPLLQSLSQPQSQSLPPSLQAQIKTLLQQFPNKDQLQQPQQLKQLIRNSGVFLESKLAFVAQSRNSQALMKSPALQNDIKSQLQKISQQLSQFQQSKADSKSPAPATALHSENKPNLPPSITRTTLASSTLQDIPQTAPKTEDKTIPPPLPAATSQATGGSQSTANPATNLDVVLQQLGRQLLASLARTQLNQLESMVHRAAVTPDNQGPSNSWILEIPIMHGNQIDNLELRIDQEQAGNDADQQKQKQWTVMLAFDLHALGKMSVQLQVAGKNVSATVWSQLEHTHLEVQQQINSLQKSLEKVGVSVDRVNCYHGMPSKDTPPIHQQLVDLHT